MQALVRAVNWKFSIIYVKILNKPRNDEIKCENHNTGNKKTPIHKTNGSFSRLWRGNMSLKQNYIQSLFAQEDEVLASVNDSLQKNGMPLISIPPEVGKFLYLLVKISGAKRILEIGTLGGYSTIWLARALPDGGAITTIEYKQEHVTVAKKNLQRANLIEKVTILTGDAKEVMDQLIQQKESFDFFFIDADKLNYPDYVEKAIVLANPGAVITADNLFLRGRVLDQSEQADSPRRIRQTNEILAKDPRLESLLLPIGDGIGLARVIKSD